MKDKSYLAKLYELEYLVSIDADKDKIEKLRKELNVDTRLNKGYKDFNFEPERYVKMREMGLTNDRIASEFNMSLSTLYKLKMEHGLLK